MSENTYRSSTDDENDSSSSDEDMRIQDGHGFVFMAAYLLMQSVDRTPCRTSALTGNNYIAELLSGHPTRCYEQLRVKPHVLLLLCERLKGLNMLQDTRNVSAEEQLAIGLNVLCQASTQRTVAERFQHSTATVHKCVKTTVRALVKLGTEIIRPPNRGPVQPEILRNQKYYPYFEKCLGAIDGTHVAAWAPASKQKMYRGRKGSIVTQNVMAVCSFNMMFTYVHAGWEGSANDARVFVDALSKPEYGFPMPTDGYYYVVDAGYPNIPGFLAPYRGESYHLNEFHGRGRIRNKHALFNYRHSSLRNVIERCFGLLKARFPILKYIHGYPLRRQARIPLACCAMHNFIRMHDAMDQLFTEYGTEDIEFPSSSSESSSANEPIELDMSQQHVMNAVREDIANAIWGDSNR